MMAPALKSRTTTTTTAAATEAAAMNDEMHNSHSHHSNNNNNASGKSLVEVQGTLGASFSGFSEFSASEDPMSTSHEEEVFQSDDEELWHDINHAKNTIFHKISMSNHNVYNKTQQVEMNQLEVMQDPNDSDRRPTNHDSDDDDIEQAQSAPIKTLRRVRPNTTALPANQTTNTNLVNTNSTTQLHQQQQQQDNQHRNQLIQESAKQDEATQEKFVLQDESKTIALFRWILFGVSFVIAVILSSTVYVTLRQDQQDDFDTAVQQQALATQASFQHVLHTKLQTWDTLSNDIASHAQTTTSSSSSSPTSSYSWPFVTIPDFHQRGIKYRALAADSLAILFMPLVPAWMSMEWDHFYNQVAQEEYGTTTTTNDSNDENRDSNRTILVDFTSPGWFVPFWQTSPPVEELANYQYDMLQSSLFGPLLQDAVLRKEALLGPTFTGSDLVDQDNPLGAVWDAILKENNNNNKNNNDPLSWYEPLTSIIYPIFRDYPQDLTVVGLLVSIDAWKDHFDNTIAVTNQMGTYYLLERDDDDDDNNNNDNNNVDGIKQTTLTFFGQDGATTIHFQGEGDLRESGYGGVSSRLAVDVQQLALSVSTVQARYTLSVYPSRTWEDDYTTTDPVIYAVVMGVILVIPLVLFLAYDHLVAQRHRAFVRRLVAFTTTTNIPSSFAPTLEGQRVIPGYAEPDKVESTQMNCTNDSDQDEKKNKKNKMGQDNSMRSIESHGDVSESSFGGYVVEPAKHRLKSYLSSSKLDTSGAALNGGSSREMRDNSRPMAEFFPECTVMVADFAGFTAWVSQREPSQVFTLLQCVFERFDQAAQMRGVHKVESIGDSYIAVTGVPEPHKDHALIMAGFALECRKLVKNVTRALERSLGPETGDLAMRFGLSSGPITAGVLQGDRDRFQIFGDTVTTAAAMESTGRTNFIQVCENTANLILEGGKQHWLTPREDQVQIKQKGAMNTYWLDAVSEIHRRMSTDSTFTTGSFAISRKLSQSKLLPTEIARDGGGTMWDAAMRGSKNSTKRSSPRNLLRRQKDMDWVRSEVSVGGRTRRKKPADNTTRLVDWNVELLMKLLKQVVARRESKMRSSLDSTIGLGSHQSVTSISDEMLALRDKTTGSVLEEVTEIIKMPEFDPEAARIIIEPSSVNIDWEVEEQMRKYITMIASMYRDNPFHNYEHACHVQMSMYKLLQRVVSPDEIDYEGESSEVVSDAHTYTYGITSDPLTQFAVVFCALIHDVDHTGVTNNQLIKENAHLATVYKNKSIAEQNSIDLAWDLLMDPQFEAFRGCIFNNVSEFKRFRQLVVNVVLATDIFDKDLSALRKNRWNKAFKEKVENEAPRIDENRKATIVIEHLIQASDVSHTMQHWDIYRKWNECLFYEMYLSYKSGRTDVDPSEGWYNGELWFFDNYVIPLAKKLKECGVFGVSSDECLNYALENRRMWVIHGEKFVEELRATDYFEKIKAKQRPANQSYKRLLRIPTDGSMDSKEKKTGKGEESTGSEEAMTTMKGKMITVDE